jgi:hypothetical protein
VLTRCTYARVISRPAQARRSGQCILCFYTNPLRRAQVISEYPELTLGDLNCHKRCSSLDITVAFYRMKDCASVPIYSSLTARWFKLS